MYIHNVSGSEKTYKGQSIDDAAFWAIPSVMLVHYSSDEVLLTDIMNGDAAISLDGAIDISDKNEMIDTLKGIYVEISGKSSIQEAMPVVMYKPEEVSFARATHDFCNKTTWYQESVAVIDEVATTSDNLTYEVTNICLIDVINGMVNRQDLLQEYAIVVKVNDVVVTNYTIDHAAGEITFAVSTIGTIKVSYNYAVGSTWTIAPEATKLLIIEHSELQFCTDIEVNTPVRFEIWISNPYFGAPGHPLEFYTGKLEYQTVQYNSMKDIVNESNLGTGIIPQVADLPGDVQVFPFNYISVKPIQSSYGAELRVKCVGDVELTGSYGVASFYLITRSE